MFDLLPESTLKSWFFGSLLNV